MSIMHLQQVIFGSGEQWSDYRTGKRLRDLHNGFLRHVLGTVQYTWWREYPAPTGTCPNFSCKWNVEDGKSYDCFSQRHRCLLHSIIVPAK